MTKKKIATIVAALLALLGAVKTMLDSLPDAPAPASPAVASADAGAP